MEENLLLSNDKVLSIINENMNVEVCLNEINDNNLVQNRFDELIKLMQKNNFYILFGECIELEECIVFSMILRHKNDNKEIELKLFYSLCDSVNSSIHFFLNIDDSIFF